jgi:hypothetical protein
MQILFLCGRSPALAQKEIEAAATILPVPWVLTIVASNLVLLKLAWNISEDKGEIFANQSQKTQEIFSAVYRLQQRLGGTVRSILPVASVDEAAIISTIDILLQSWAVRGEGKRAYAISVLGEGLTDLTDQLGSLEFKRRLQAAGRTARQVLPVKGTALSTGQVEGNSLAVLLPDGRWRRDGLEIVLVPNPEGEWWVGFTLTCQSARRYAQRDFGIPAADARSGMLPPKLAQMLVNLAAGPGKAGKWPVIYDPFCGNGRVVSEALLMGLPAYGSDVEKRKVRASRENLRWLNREFALGLNEPQVTETYWTADARVPHSRGRIIELAGRRPWVIATEPYLGKPLRASLSPTEHQEWLEALQPIYQDFLSVWRPDGEEEGKNSRPECLVMVFPAARTAGPAPGAADPAEEQTDQADQTDGPVPPADGGEGERAEAATWLPLFDSMVDRINRLGYDARKLGRYSRPDSFVSRDIIHLTYR